MGIDLIGHLAKKKAEQPDLNYLGVYCQLDYPDPNDISYNIHSFGDSRVTENQKSLWNKAGGVDAFIEFTAGGIVEYPDEFGQSMCNLSVNGLGSIDRYELLEKGAIGGGFFERDTFRFQIFLSLEQTRGLIEQMKLRQSVPEDQRKRFPVRFDIFDLVKRTKNVSFSICRIYCGANTI
jgi:hypothetical protein